MSSLWIPVVYMRPTDLNSLSCFMAIYQNYIKSRCSAWGKKHTKAQVLQNRFKVQNISTEIEKNNTDVWKDDKKICLLIKISLIILLLDYLWKGSISQSCWTHSYSLQIINYSPLLPQNVFKCSCYRHISLINLQLPLTYITKNILINTWIKTFHTQYHRQKNNKINVLVHFWS